MGHRARHQSAPMNANQSAVLPSLGGGSEISVAEASDPPVAVGRVDELSKNTLRGWAWDPARPDAPVTVEVVDGDEVIVTLEADEYRPDLHDAGMGNGYHGFQLNNLGSLLTRPFHRLSIRRADDHRELECSPGWISCFWSEPGEVGSELIEQIATATIRIAQRAEDIDGSLESFLAAAKRMAEAQILLHRNLAGRRQAGARGSMASIWQQYPDLELREAVSPRVSVIIPVHNCFRLTYDCLKSISEHLPEVAFEIIVVDDCSSDETLFAGLILRDAVRIERMPVNSGFIACCNRGAELAQGEFLFFLNNDTLVQPGWLDELVATFERSDDVGIAGARLLFADGRVQDAGGLVWRLGDAWNWGRGADPEDPRFRFMRDCDYITGAALMIRTKVFASLGGFDPLYAPAYYEDTDLAFRVRETGLRVVMQPAAQIVHLEGGTGGRDTNGTGAKRYQTINHAKFFKRWRQVLARHRLNGHEPEREAERSVIQRAYFIDDCVPTPDRDAGSNAALQHMLALMALGYKVIFIPGDNLLRADPYTRDLERLGIECIHAPSCVSTEQFFRADREPPNLVYLHRISNAFKYAAMVRWYFPQCHILYSVSDLHFLRLARQAAIEGRRDLERQAEEMRVRELHAMTLVDSVVVHSDYEKAVLRRMAPTLNAHVVRWTVPGRVLETPIAARSGIAFVAGFAHHPNADAAIYLARDIMPHIRKSRQPLKCIIGGSNITGEILALAAADIDVVGFIPDLATLFGKLRCSVAPLRYGAGIKGKVLESFSYGVPCVMSEIAAEGLNLPGALAWLVATSPQEFADKVLALHRDDQMVERLSRACQDYIAGNFSKEVVVEQLRIVIERRSEEPTAVKRMEDFCSCEPLAAPTHAAAT